MQTDCYDLRTDELTMLNLATIYPRFGHDGHKLKARDAFLIVQYLKKFLRVPINRPIMILVIAFQKSSSQSDLTMHQT